MPSTPLETALGYIGRNWNPVPNSFRSKKPIGDEWHLRVIDTNSAPLYFNGKQLNVGVQLGASSRGLTDVDLDSPEAVAVGPYLLPKTQAIFGRVSKRSSHWLYYTDLSTTQDNAAIQLKAPDGTMLLELRSGGGDRGAQTVFPGSVHESGEAIAWEENGEPADVDDADLLTRVKLIAAAALIAGAWPHEGGRHHAALVLGGLLARAGFPEAQIKLITEAVARAAGDGEWRDRVKAAEDAARNHQNGGRTYGLPQLTEIVGEAAAKRIAQWLDYDARKDPAPGDDVGPAELDSIRASNVTVQPVHWLWPNRFALGKLGLIVGLPDEGKGQLLCDVAARVTRGAEWPCAEGLAPLGSVVCLGAEDDLADTVVPRLIAADADLERIHFLGMVSAGSRNRMFSLVTDLRLLRQKIIDIGDVVLCQIDPISAYLGVGKVDSFRSTDVRAVLGPVVELAAELQIAIIGVLHFNKKVDITNALLRISDSLAFGAAARHVYGVVGDATNRRKLVVRAKNNLASDRADQALAFHFDVRQVGADPETGKEIMAPHILWEPQHVDVTALEAMQAAADNRAPTQRDEAKKFLADMLAHGPVAKTEIEDAAQGNGISLRTLERAKSALKVVAKKDTTTFHGGWTWQLPDQPKSPLWKERDG